MGGFLSPDGHKSAKMGWQDMAVGNMWSLRKGGISEKPPSHGHVKFCSTNKCSYKSWRNRKEMKDSTPGIRGDKQGE